MIDVLIVGAGLAGLVAADTLVAEGMQVTVLEARDRVGGRTLNERIDESHVVEMGGQWIGPTQDRVRALVDRLGLETYPTFIDGDTVAEAGGQRYRYLGPMPKLSPLVVADIAQAVWRLERMSEKIPLGRPWDAPNARELDFQTFESWIRKYCKTAFGREHFRTCAQVIFSANAARLSLFHVAFYFKSAGSMNAIIMTEHGAQQDRVVGGSQLISERLAQKLGPVVRLNEPVRSITYREDQVKVSTGSVEYSAKRCIVALPPTLAGRLVYSPAMPSLRDQLTQATPMGAVIKCQAVYESPFWRDEGLNGSAVYQDGPLQVVFDNSPHASPYGVLLGFVDGAHATELSKLSAKARERVVLDCLVRFFGRRAGVPIKYLEKDWSADEYSRGGYGAHFPPGVWSTVGSALREPVGPVHWAGSETAERWSGYMDGAVSSGERAGREVLASLMARQL